MLDGECSFQHVLDVHATIYWGAYVGMPQQILSAGPLSDQCDAIMETRAKARAENGWIMDIYLLRKEPPLTKHT
jgi:precorrin-6A synthase